jgi:hypothetical protein
MIKLKVNGRDRSSTQLRSEESVGLLWSAALAYRRLFWLGAESGDARNRRGNS